MDFLDTDGDCIQFLIDPKGKLREYVNGKLELEDVRWLRYDAGQAMLTDEKGMMTLQEKDRVEKVLGIHCLAMRAGITWQGDPPAPCTSVAVEDTDGDRLEFLVKDMKLQEFNNGELELDAVNSMCFKFADGSITDDTGVFKLPPRECMQKVAALYSLAMQVGLEWTGDHPHQVSGMAVGSEPKVLEIENCAGDWEFQCPRLWENLKATEEPKKRYCDTCRENVYFCDSIEEVQSHTLQRRCVAFVSTPMEVDATADDLVTLRVALLSGDELPEIRVPPAATVRDVKQVIAQTLGYPLEEQRLLMQGTELMDIEKIDSYDLSKEALQLLRVLKPVVERPLGGRRVKMGKRRKPPKYE